MQVAIELELFDEEANTARAEAKVTIVHLFTTYLRWPIFIAIMMMFSQQLSGINAAMFYSTKIFMDAGLSVKAAVYATILMGTINVIQTIISVWLVDHPRFGRRSLHITGLLGMFVSSVFICLSMTFVNIKDEVTKAPVYPWVSYAAIFFVLLFVISFATGPGSIPWFYVSEIFPSNARGAANSVAVMSNWAANTLVTVTFLWMKVRRHF